MEMDKNNLTPDQEKFIETYRKAEKALNAASAKELMVIPADFEITSIQTAAGGFTKGKDLRNHQQVITWYPGTGEAVAMTKEAWQQLAGLIPTMLEVLSKETPKAVEQQVGVYYDDDGEPHPVF